MVYHSVSRKQARLAINGVIVINVKPKKVYLQFGDNLDGVIENYSHV
jgi:hypothetical protein